jgi:hypothetical protein
MIFGGPGGLVVPELFSVAYGTTEVVPSHGSSRARAPAPHGQMWIPRSSRLTAADRSVRSTLGGARDGRVGGTGRIGRNAENDTDDAGAVESHVSKGARRGAPAARAWLRGHARSLDFARDDRIWDR